MEYKTKTKDFILTTWETIEKGYYLTLLETRDKSCTLVGFKSKSRTGAKLSAILHFCNLVTKSNTSKK